MSITSSPVGEWPAIMQFDSNVSKKSAVSRSYRYEIWIMCSRRLNMGIEKVNIKIETDSCSFLPKCKQLPQFLVNTQIISAISDQMYRHSTQFIQKCRDIMQWRSWMTSRSTRPVNFPSVFSRVCVPWQTFHQSITGRRRLVGQLGGHALFLLSMIMWNILLWSTRWLRLFS